MRFTPGNVIYLLFFMGIAVATTQFTGIFGDKSTTILYWLAAIGVTSSAFWMFFAQKWEDRKAAKAAAQSGGEAAPAGAPTGDAGEIGGLIKEAETKLGASRLGKGGTISQYPVIFVLGDKGSTKTTVLTHSGMEPELLAGQVFQQDNQVAPTRTANLWFAKKAVFVESGGPLWADGSAFGNLLKKLAPPKLKSIFGSGESAPRAALLCVDIERFLQQGASDSMAAAARGIQSRLNEISTQFGISFPVYVLFTRCDRVTFFLDYVRNLSNEESTQVFGVTLPMRPANSGVYGEEENRRLSEMFNELFGSLADKRIEFLPRENDATKLPGCYEFPREFRKLRALLVQFLVDVGRPSQLSTSPFLRGFYFTGVRPVVVSDVAATPLIAPQQRYDAGGSATRMFSMKEMQQQVQQQAAQQSGGRKVPQWVFLSHLFNDVILEDKAALGASAASTKTSGVQRAMLALAALLALGFSIAATVSFFKNRGLENELIEAAETLSQVKLAPNAVAAEPDIKKLKGLREKLELITKWRKEGAPWSYRWGLYVGDDLYTPTRTAYYNGFAKLLFRETQQARMLGYLQSRPAKSDSDVACGYNYETLRAYLLTTSEWKRMGGDGEPKRLSDTLVARWSEKREGEIGESRRKAAEEEFQFYARDLVNGNPYAESSDAAGVHASRLFQSSCAGIDAIYARLINEASAQNPAANYNALYRGTGACVVNNRDVRGAFTKKGWDWMKKNAMGKNLAGDDWVLGPPDKYPRAAMDAASITSEIWRRYTGDFIGRWREYFAKNTTVLGYGGPKDAVNKLQCHVTQSAVLALIALASQNVSVDGDDAYAKQVKAAFTAVTTVVPSPGTQINVSKNAPYADALGNFSATVSSFSEKPDDPVRGQLTETKKAEGKGIAANVSRVPSPDLEARLEQTVLAIMSKPFDFDTRPDPGAVNAAAGAFCKQFNVISAKFPFKPDAKPEVDLNELNSLLKPQTGAFWVFYQQNLEQYIKKAGNQYMPVAGAPFNFTSSFLAFFNQVAALSEALYRGSAEPRLSYQIKFNNVTYPIQGQTLSGKLKIDNGEAGYKGPAGSFVWTGSPAHSVQLELNSQVQGYKTGMWAIFHFFVSADQAVPSGSGYSLVYPVTAGREATRTANVEFLVDLGGAPPVFDKRFLSGMRCIANAATK